MSIPDPGGLRVLVIEDQLDIAANLWDFLERRGHAVDHCADGVAGLARARAGGFDAIVLDLGLPRLDGLQLCRALRDAGDGVPVLMLTARDTLEDKLRGYAEGADDYMVKPFALRELEARLRALHRRNAPAATIAPLAHAGLGYDPAALVATREGRRIPLTRMQGALLATLLAQAPHVCRRERLLRTLWPEGEGDAAALHTLVYELRGLVDRPFAQPLLSSVRGVGYRIAEAP
jgi:DNA-binding response OmpR family regulator